jgi:hypothetical protein
MHTVCSSRQEEDTMTTLAKPAPAKLTAIRLRARATAVAAAVLAPAVIWLVAVPLLGVDLRVAQPSGRPPAEITLPLVLATALAASLAGCGLLALLERQTSRARAVWTSTALVALAVSFVPLLTPGTSTTSRTVLAVLHLTVAAILIPSLARNASAHAAA